MRCIVGPNAGSWGTNDNYPPTSVASSIVNVLRHGAFGTHYSAPRTSVLLTRERPGPTWEENSVLTPDRERSISPLALRRPGRSWWCTGTEEAWSMRRLSPLTAPVAPRSPEKMGTEPTEVTRVVGARWMSTSTRGPWLATMREGRCTNPSRRDPPPLVMRRQ